MMAANALGFDLGAVYSNVDAIKTARHNLKVGENAIRDAEDLKTARGAAMGQQEGGFEQLAALDPQEAIQIRGYFNGLDEKKKAEEVAAARDRTDTIGRLAAYVQGAADPQAAYGQVRANLPAEMQGQLPEGYDPNFIEMTLAQSMSMDQLLDQVEGRKAANVMSAALQPPDAPGLRQGMVDRGLPEHVADGFLMNFQDESGLDPGINEQNPTVAGSRGGFGLAQWTGPRRVALEQYAAQTGKSLANAQTQLDFMMTELSGSEKSAAQSIMATTTPQEAAAVIAEKFLRPAPENLARRVEKYTGAPGQDPRSDPAIRELMTAQADPSLSDPQREVIGMVLQRLMPEAAEQRAPMAVSPGTTVFDPNTQQAIFQAPQQSEPGFRSASPEEVAQYGPGQVGPDGRFYPIKDSGGMTVFGPDGQPIVTTGSAGGKFTEGQSKDNVYVTRARGALETVDIFGDALTSRADIVAGEVPLGMARGMQSAEFQQAQQAGNEFLSAILRKDTGAAITADEQASYGRTYLPQPGDGPEVLVQKRTARARAVAAIEAGMTSQQLLAVERAGQATSPAAPPELAPAGNGVTTSGTNWRVLE